MKIEECRAAPCVMSDESHTPVAACGRETESEYMSE